jgi:hypothetical protein
LVILVDGKVVGSALSLIVDESLVDKNNTTWILAKYTFRPTIKRDVLYGIDIFIHQLPWTALRRRLYDARKELCEQLNLKAIVFAGRDP